MRYNVCMKLLAAAFAVMAGLGDAPDAAPHACPTAGVDAALAGIVRGGSDAAGGVGPAPAATLVVIRDGEAIYEGAAGCARFDDAGDCTAPMTPATKFRAASVSKMATAFAALSLAQEGAVDLDTDISEYYGFSLRNPSYPSAPITLRQLLAHVSTVRDPEAYWVAAPGLFRPLIENNGDVFASADGAPGAYFSYANLNYGVAAGVLEIASGVRFDVLASSRVLEPLGLDAGFNWSGAPAAARANGATLYRLVDDQWTAQADSDDMLNSREPAILAEDGLDRDAYLERYRPGDNPTLFSPQGGLRANAGDLARLAAALAPGGLFENAGEPLWTYDPSAPNGDTGNGFYLGYGLGTQVVDVKDRRLVGHAGEAYGLLSGAWLLEGASPVAFAYAVTGTPPQSEQSADTAFSRTEQRFIELALTVATRCAGDPEKKSP